ncbi:HET-domain-containing protein [Trematosphaeria pertusa]|uniref:HET-domain-containing protein n=1 Tax=Trematosphaeria pertusa TaxID=390896 RepID=A0A6A6IF46_9PLEO|nr:HET-domain-containing protein [Trematosphaeria pertusa]KAF2248522.1 HET-domain-containing protein [Trematosphaeria pertusa]
MVAGTIIRSDEQETTNSIVPATTPIHPGDEFRHRGRQVPSKANIGSIKYWMQLCDTHHENCHIPSHVPENAQQIRLIDVRDYKIVPAFSEGKSLPYVALSYVWGRTATGLLNRHNIAQCSSFNGLKDVDIPPTISDAIEVVRLIGKRYLWVDTLCIVQDDDSDKQQQLPIMDRIYSCAELVIVAAAGQDARAGLPGVGSTERRVSQRTETINGTRFITTQPPFRQVLRRSVWDSRGWTFQEATLCKRLLVFTERQVYWVCQTTTWCEDTSGESPTHRLELTETNSLNEYLLEPNKCRTVLYCRLVEAFSSRHFTDESDALWAFAGILKLMASRFQRGFIWGLPHERLDAALLWGQVGCNLVHLRTARHPAGMEIASRSLPYPSWSWLSCCGQVAFLDPCGSSVISEVTWHEPIGLEDATTAKYLNSIRSTGRTGKPGGDQRSNLFSESASDTGVMQYGLLHFTAQTSKLTLKRMKETTDEEGKATEGDRTNGEKDSNEQDNLEGDYGAAEQEKKEKQQEKAHSSEVEWVLGAVHAPDGDRIGAVFAPPHFFIDRSECSGELVLLSSNAQGESDETCRIREESLDIGCIQHVKGCSHIQSRNVMLIEWIEDVAYRRGIGRLEKDGWEKVVAEDKRIILG